MPDFRGNEGFWNAYPPYARLGLSFRPTRQSAVVRRRSDPGLGLLRPSDEPLSRHAAARRLSHPPVVAGRMASGTFVYTSNVDGHFQRTASTPSRSSKSTAPSMDAVYSPLWCRTVRVRFVHNSRSMKRRCRREPLPACPECGDWLGPTSSCSAMATGITPDHLRGESLPAVVATNRGQATDDCGVWRRRRPFRPCGAVRTRHRDTPRHPGGINVREAQVPPRGIGLASGALAALSAIDALLPHS